MTIKVKYKASIYGPDSENPEKPKLLFKNRTKHALLEIEDIEAIFNYHGKNGKNNPKKCEIFHRSLGNIVVDFPFNQLVKLKEDNRFTVRGFRYKGQK
jgi:hypothetical protein